MRGVHLRQSKIHVLIVGAGPAGLTAAFELTRAQERCDVFESESVPGGISRTERRGVWLFDLGGHRFFTKVPRVESFWYEILGEEDFMLRPRMSRIFYQGRFYDYPLKALNALSNLGLWEAFLCLASYLRVRLFPPKDLSNFETWVASKFGWRLYRKFFKTYTEKVWGIPATEIQSEWAAQRIKNLSLSKAIINALKPSRKSDGKITSLIEQFHYPKYGPGMLWEKCAEVVSKNGQKIHYNEKVVKIERGISGELVMISANGNRVTGSHLISSMPINDLVSVLRPSVPSFVLEAASKLKHRDFLIVALVVPEESSFPDNWIYIHSPEVKVGRIQNYGAWSPYMKNQGKTCLGLEYFVSSKDHLWNAKDHDIIEFAANELESIGLVQKHSIGEGYVVRVEKAYPVYDNEYANSLRVIREFLAAEWPEIYPVGRNGMHRYNNQDHSMLTAMTAVDNILRKSNSDIWAINVDEEYHEIIDKKNVTAKRSREAPIFLETNRRRTKY